MKFSFALPLHDKAFSAGLGISETVSFCLVSMKAGSLLQAALGKRKNKKKQTGRRIRNEIQEVRVSLAAAEEVSVEAAEAAVLSDIFNILKNKNNTESFSLWKKIFALLLTGFGKGSNRHWGGRGGLTTGQ